MTTLAILYLVVTTVVLAGAIASPEDDRLDTALAGLVGLSFALGIALAIVALA